MRKCYQIETKGTGQFPFDMLRYSRCWPVAAQDAENLSFDPESKESYQKPRVVCVALIGNAVEAAHCVERFKSFSWRAEIYSEESL